MDADGKVIGKPAGRTVTAFRQGARYLTLAAKEKRTTDEEVEMIELGLAMGRVKPAEAKTKMGELELNDEQKGKIEKAIKQAEYRAKVIELLSQLKSRADVQTKGPGIGKELYGMYKEGFRPQPGTRESMAMYQLIVTYGLAEKNVEAAKAAHGELKKMLGNNPRAKGFLDQLEQQIKNLEGGG